ncbi:MAG: LysM peptidoglycan-binding domain-containing protein [Candidatus Cohnella colombiensis]|uniref:LysM peptidoglycan-binding domain-containing protein n=1 Tax=Candidatus Cohnella colombiensis TaxID=3121368 RepID=A0AA95JDV0_9BACL|nr:MAG: LysM peptidoglycan-binding domain-containing protein [Cohnella sp.]
MKIHMVKQGDTLYLIAKKYNVPLEDLIKANPEISNPDVLAIGTKVKIHTQPQSAAEVIHQHIVQQGDSLWKLSKAWGIHLSDLIKANPQLKNPNALLTGEVVNIPKQTGHAEAHPHHGGAQGKANTAVLPGTSKKNTAVLPIETPPPAPAPVPVPAPAPAPIAPIEPIYPVMQAPIAHIEPIYPVMPAPIAHEPAPYYGGWMHESTQISTGYGSIYGSNDFIGYDSNALGNESYPGVGGVMTTGMQSTPGCQSCGGPSMQSIAGTANPSMYSAQYSNAYPSTYPGMGYPSGIQPFMASPSPYGYAGQEEAYNPYVQSASYTPEYGNYANQSFPPIPPLPPLRPIEEPSNPYALREESSFDELKSASKKSNTKSRSRVNAVTKSKPKRKKSMPLLKW